MDYKTCQSLVLCGSLEAHLFTCHCVLYHVFCFTFALRDLSAERLKTERLGIEYAGDIPIREEESKKRFKWRRSNFSESCISQDSSLEMSNDPGQSSPSIRTSTFLIAQFLSGAYYLSSASIIQLHNIPRPVRERKSSKPVKANHEVLIVSDNRTAFDSHLSPWTKS